MENKTRNNIIRVLHKKMGEAHELLDQIDNCDVDDCDEPGYAWCEAHPDRRICSYHATPDEDHECYFCPECYAGYLADQTGETKQCSCDTTRGEGDCPKPASADLIPREEHERALDDVEPIGWANRHKGGAWSSMFSNARTARTCAEFGDWAEIAIPLYRHPAPVAPTAVAPAKITAGDCVDYLVGEFVAEGGR